MDWKVQLADLNRALGARLAALGPPAQRRQQIQEQAGAECQRLERRPPAAFRLRLGGRSVVGVDGSLHTVGGEPPHNLALIRAAAVPAGAPDPGALARDGLLRHEVWSPLLAGGGAGADVSLQLQRRQTALEAEVAVRAAADLRPILLLIDGGLVRFYKEAAGSFTDLTKIAIENDVLVVGVIENVESTALQAYPGVPAAWRGVSDRTLLWGILEYGEVLKLREPLRLEGEGSAPTGALHRWFVQSSRAGAPVGLDFLEAQVAGQDLTWVAEYLFTLSPEDGRGIPVWMDMVDRLVRITTAEVQTWVQAFLDEEIQQRLLAAKRSRRPRF